jgi:glutathione synthase/RimK-type ligase-like ATP-grasp enzyme
VWDAKVDWSRYDLVVLRATWDYAERRDDFLAWARSLPRVVNPLPVLEWNTDKERYLTDLAAAGVPVVPTEFVAPGVHFEPPGEPFVVKPAISAGGRSSGRFEGGDAAAGELVQRIHGDGRTAMVQPYLGDVTETDLVFIDGAYSHSLQRRVPLPAGGDQDVFFLAEELVGAEATPGEREVAEAALAATPGALLYGRVDLVDGVVLELEIAEPSLYLAFGEGAAERLARAITRCLTRGSLYAG